MKIKLLIASSDVEYREYLSKTLSEKYVDIFEINVCTSVSHLKQILSQTKQDAALLEHEFISETELASIKMPFKLYDPLITEDLGQANIPIITKYQRISSIAGEIIMRFSETDKIVGNHGGPQAVISVSWSPAGGSGKTTAALAYASNKAAKGKKTVYLNLENFTSTSAYFLENDKSISKVFEKLGSNVHMFLLGVRQQDSGSGIYYFCGPDNYEDINILTPDDIETLINACAIGVDELVVDFSSNCCDRVKKAFSIADKVLLVSDGSSGSQVKIRQFFNQHNVFSQIQEKIILINNKGAKTSIEKVNKTIDFPFVDSNDPISVFKSLSGESIGW